MFQERCDEGEWVILSRMTLLVDLGQYRLTGDF